MSEASEKPENKAGRENTTPGDKKKPPAPVQKPGEIGGTAGPEPTRYGDWEKDGRCTDF